MKNCILSFVAAMLLLFFVSTSHAEQVALIVTGAAGEGLLPGNIAPSTSSSGSGGIGSGGLSYDTETNLLTVDIEWGTENGFSDLTGDVTMLHLHGPTADEAPFNFGQVNPQILINLGNSLNFNASASGGGLEDVFFLSNQQEEYLLSGRTYINVHTSEYPFGEIRGYIVPASAIPEPTSAVVLCGLSLLAIRRRPKAVVFSRR